MIDYVGWIYGIIAYCVVQFMVLDKMMQFAIEFRYSKINQGATWGVILSIFGIFVIELQNYVHTNTCAFVYFMFIIICILNVSVTNSPPLYVEAVEDRPSLVQALLNSSPFDGPLPPNPDEDPDAKKSRDDDLLTSPEIMDRGLEDLKLSKPLELTEVKRDRDIEQGMHHTYHEIAVQ